MCILFVYALLKVVSYYDLSVLSMSVMGFPKKFGWVLSSIQVFFLDFWNFLTLQSPLPSSVDVWCRYFCCFSLS